MPISAPREVTNNSLTDLMPIPMGIAEQVGKEGLLGLIQKLAGTEDLASHVNPNFSKERFAKDLLEDFNSTIEQDNMTLEPGVHVFPLGTMGKAKQLMFIGPGNKVIGGATVNEMANAPGKFYTSEFAIDKSKGLLAAKAAAHLGKKLLEMGAADIGEGAISTDTYNMIQHLAKMFGK